MKDGTEMPVELVDFAEMPFVLLADASMRMTLSSNGSMNQRMAAALLGRLALYLEAEADLAGDPPIPAQFAAWLDLRWAGEDGRYL